MFEASIEMCFRTEEHDMLKVSVINMRIYSEQSFENDFNYVHEVFWEWDTKSAWEYFFVVELVLNPGH